MNISEQTDYTLNHPAFKLALENHRNGFVDDLRYILIILQKESAYRTKDGLIRRYGACKHLNIADIKHELSIFEIPFTMDARMPVVKPVDPTATLFSKKNTSKSKNQVPDNQQSLFMQVA